jgi:hypothetical protein
MTIDLFSLCIGMVVGILLTLAATILAVGIIDWREMRRVKNRPLWVKVQHEWTPYETPPPAQPQPGPLKPETQKVQSNFKNARKQSSNQQFWPLLDHLPQTDPRIRQFNTPVGRPATQEG